MSRSSRTSWTNEWAAAIGCFGAHNAGPARYAGWLAGERRLPGETRAYIAAVAGPGVGARAAPVRLARADRAGEAAAPGAPDRGEDIFFIRR